MGAGERRDYLPAGYFDFELDGVVVGHFSEIQGLKMETEVVPYTDGNDPKRHFRPGRTAYSKATVKRGDLRSPELWNWYQEVIKGVAQRKSASIVFKDRTMTEKLRYNLFETWPCAWEGPAFNSEEEGKHQVESMTFVVEDIQRVGG